jgi:16S rRNA G966 N2-methylase RsmD
VARPRLNDLSGSEWIRFTRSWFVENPPPRRPAELAHPAKFPESMAESFVRFFTRPGMTVLDPFAGTGSTLVAALRAGRRAVGFELNPRYAAAARARVRRAAEGRPGLGAEVLALDARRLEDERRRRGWPPFDLVFTSPPYWDMLSRSRGGVHSVHRRRRAAGLDTVYSEDPRDVGNLHDYEAFLAATTEILAGAARSLAVGRYLVVVAQNLRDPEGRIRRLAWDLVGRLEGRDGLAFQGERIWCQDAKPLGIWGYPATFVPNYHHHYCLVFRRGPADGGAAPAGKATAPTGARRRRGPTRSGRRRRRGRGRSRSRTPGASRSRPSGAGR